VSLIIFYAHAIGLEQKVDPGISSFTVRLKAERTKIEQLSDCTRAAEVNVKVQ
jgi:hypothetical protein